AAVVGVRVADGTAHGVVRERGGAVAAELADGNAAARASAAAAGRPHRPARLPGDDVPDRVRPGAGGRRRLRGRAYGAAVAPVRGPGDEDVGGACGSRLHGGPALGGAVRRRVAGGGGAGGVVAGDEGRGAPGGNALARHPGPPGGVRPATGACPGVRAAI